MKKRWKGLCALWMVLVLVIGAIPVKGAAEGVPEPAPVAVSEDAKDGGGQTLADSGAEGSSSETIESTEIDSSQTENADLAGKENAGNSTEREENVESSAEKEEIVESSAEDETEKAPGQGGGSEETDKETDSTERIEGTEKETGESTEAAEGDGTSAKSSEAVSDENKSGAVEEIYPEESSPEKIPSEESSLEESSQAEILETTVSELLENTVLLKEVAREAAASGAGWLYVGSNEVNAGDIINRNSDMSGITIQFDEPFDSQSDLDGITVPQDKRLAGWRLWGFNDSGMVGVSPLGELEITGQISANDYQDFHIDNLVSFLLIVPLWRDAKAILDGDSLEMNAGDSCNLSEGTWQVEVNADAARDATAYTGGRTVYAARSGTFTFHKKE